MLRVRVMLLLLLLLLLVLLVLLWGCEASRGLYRDMQHAGQWLTQTDSE